MAVTFVTTTSPAVTFTADGDQLYVLPNGYITAVGNAVTGSFSSKITLLGSIIATGWGIGVGTTGKFTEISIGKDGTLVGGGIAMVVYGGHSIVNNGQILASGPSSYAADTVGAGTFTNFGLISATGSNSRARVNHGSPGETATTINYGTISGFYSYDALNSACLDRVYNYGAMIGDVLMSNAVGSLFDSTLGSVAGTINCGTDGDTVIAGNTGNTVLGGAGADLLYANATAAAVHNRASTTLDGKAGNNALYGSGAFTTFVGGTAAGGTNQIWGKLSELPGVWNYANNTISFANSTKGAYVDLLTGHNAYVSATANWTGSGVFEDWIAAAGANLSSVPNVVGSAGRDVIICDIGADVITGGGGGDSLYSGASGAATFDYNVYADSNTVNGYDTIVGFKTGVDTIDVSGFMAANGLGPGSLQIFTSGTSNTVYVEKTAGTFNSATDLALIVNTSGGTLRASDFLL